MKILIKTTKPKMCDKVEKNNNKFRQRPPKVRPHTHALYTNSWLTCVRVCLCLCVYLCRLGHLKVKRINTEAPKREFQSEVQQPASKGETETGAGGS